MCLCSEYADILYIVIYIYDFPQISLKKKIFLKKRSFLKIKISEESQNYLVHLVFCRVFVVVFFLDTLIENYFIFSSLMSAVSEGLVKPVANGVHQSISASVLLGLFK